MTEEPEQDEFTKARIQRVIDNAAKVILSTKLYLQAQRFEGLMQGMVNIGLAHPDVHPTIVSKVKDLSSLSLKM